MAIANWFTMLTGMFIGTVGAMMLKGESVTSPFTCIMEALMDEGGFAMAIGVIAEFIMIHILFVRASESLKI
jgi:hypothetical protein